MDKPPITIITPTTGKRSLFKLIESLKKQSVPYRHLLLWDNKREDEFLYPDSQSLKVRDLMALEDDNTYCVVIKDDMIQGNATGSALRSVGLMMANTEYVTFADSDVWFSDNHLESLMKAIKGKVWAYSLRNIYAPDGEFIGVDRFESIGDKTQLPYQLIDNNCLMVARKFGASAACLYRETTEYNDDRLMYGFLKKYGGEPGETNSPSVNQTCPMRLERFFRENCSKD